ncbi:MAG TPA: tetratricopeptide repeat protein [Bacteroidota bacterium]|nr:tetratricopeptide repeat protein [Bacteroidota bacterium]
MLKPKKKITKKEIKQDNLLTTYAKVTSFYYEHKKRISYVVLAILGVVAITVVYINNQRANNERAAAELGKIFSIYDAGMNDINQYKVAIDGMPARSILGLKAIVENYGSTLSGELARFYLANAYFHLGQFEEAIIHYEKFSTNDKLLEASALAGLAACYEAKHEYEPAASNFESGANAVTNAVSTPDYLNAAARCYGLAGEKEKAIALYKRIKKEFPTSSYAREVDRYINQLSA